MLATTRRREAFTLIELLVVMGILAFLMALTALYFVTVGPNNQTQRGADLLSSWLLTARQQARRDGQPYGLRLVPDGNGYVTQLQYIQQPDDFAPTGSVYIGRVESPPYNIARIQSSVNLTDPSAFPVQAGDYFEIYGSGVLRRIVNFPNTASPVAQDNPASPNGIYQLCLAPPPPPPANPPYALTDYTGIALPPSPTTLGPSPPTNYRIIAQPRVVDGEPVLTMPQDVAIDLNSRSWNVYSPGGALSNPPVRGRQYEILFGPSGNVIGQGTGMTQIILWVRNTAKGPNDPDRYLGGAILVTTQTRTGFIAQHSVPGSGDPYAFARDGRSSGM